MSSNQFPAMESGILGAFMLSLENNFPLIDFSFLIK